jgi:hypothetical protein
MTVDPQLDRLVGAQCSITEIMLVWVLSLAGLRGSGFWSEYCAGLCRTWGPGPVEQRSCMFVSSTQQAFGVWTGRAEIMQHWGAWPSEMELLQGCAGLEGMWPGGDHKCLWIPSLKGLSYGDPVGLRGWEFGVAQPWQGKGAEPENWRSHSVWSSNSTGLWGGV